MQLFICTLLTCDSWECAEFEIKQPSIWKWQCKKRLLNKDQRYGCFVIYLINHSKLINMSKNYTPLIGYWKPKKHKRKHKRENGRNREKYRVEAESSGQNPRKTRKKKEKETKARAEWLEVERDRRRIFSLHVRDSRSLWRRSNNPGFDLEAPRSRLPAPRQTVAFSEEMDRWSAMYCPIPPRAESGCSRKVRSPAQWKENPTYHHTTFCPSDPLNARIYAKGNS